MISGFVESVGEHSETFVNPKTRDCRSGVVICFLYPHQTLENLRKYQIQLDFMESIHNVVAGCEIDGVFELND